MADPGLLRRVHLAERARTFPRRNYFGLPTPSPEVLSPDGKWYATLIDENVALRSAADGGIHALTADGTFDDAWDVESTRLTLGAGISIVYVPFTPWSPDSLKLWATLTDRSKLPRKGELRYMDTLERIVPRPFAVAGGHLDHVRPHILHILSGERVAVDVDTEDRYFNLLGWLPDSSEALFARFSRDFKSVDVMAASARDGSVRTLFTETADTFVKIQHDVVSFGNTGFTALPDGSGFLWESTRDGWNHLYLYRNDGRLERQLTRGDYPVLEVREVDQENGWVYFTAHGERPPRLRHPPVPGAARRRRRAAADRGGRPACRAVLPVPRLVPRHPLESRPGAPRGPARRRRRPGPDPG